MNVPKWASWCRKHREAQQKSRREMSMEADVDPSYWTLIENSGRVPKRDVTARVVAVLCPGNLREQDVGMLLAGYSPINVSPNEIMRAIDKIHEARGDGNSRARGKGTRVVPQD